MSRYSLELRMLKKIPAKYAKATDRVWDSAGGFGPLDDVYGPAPERPDPWHVTLQVRSRYWTMDDIKQYIKSSHPDAASLDFGTWSMTGGYMGRDITASFPGGVTVQVPRSVYEALATDHVDPRSFECVQEAWSLDLPYGQEPWLEPLLPCYVSGDMLDRIPKLRLAFAKKTSPEELADRIGNAGCTGSMSPDVLGFLADGLAHARACRCALWACLVS